MTVIFLVLVFATLGFGLSYADVQPKSIFLLAGQSSMSGRGGIVNNTWDKLVPLECSPNPSILRLTRNLTWELAKEPLHQDIDLNQTCGVGPGMSFANSILQLKPSLGSIGLVPCAIGGTFLNQWDQGTDNYKLLIERARTSTRNGGVLRGLLWYQGESDIDHIESAQTYGKNFTKFINDVRNDLLSPTLPFIQVALASGEGSNYTFQLVREAQLGVNLPNVSCVDALGLELSDKFHLTTHSEVLLGEKLAQAFKALD